MVKLLSISNEEALREVSVSVGRSVVLLLCRLGVSVMPGQQPIRWNKQPERERSNLPNLFAKIVLFVESSLLQSCPKILHHPCVENGSKKKNIYIALWSASTLFSFWTFVIQRIFSSLYSPTLFVCCCSLISTATVLIRSVDLCQTVVYQNDRRRCRLWLHQFIWNWATTCHKVLFHKV